MAETPLIEGVRAFQRLRPHEQTLIGPNWSDVIATAIRLRKETESLIDGTVAKVMKEHGIDGYDDKRKVAYQRLLTEFYLFGSEAKSRSAGYEKKHKEAN